LEGLFVLRWGDRDLGLLSFAEEEEEEEESAMIKFETRQRQSTQRKANVKKILRPLAVAPSSQRAQEDSKQTELKESKEGAESLQEALLQKMRKKQEAYDKPNPPAAPSAGPEMKKPAKDGQAREALLELERQRAKYKKRQSTSKADRQKNALKALSAFNSTLRAQIKETSEHQEEESVTPTKELMYDRDYDKDEPEDPSWMSHKLKFTTPIHVRPPRPHSSLPNL
jgi:hypothetical protein